MILRDDSGRQKCIAQSALYRRSARLVVLSLELGLWLVLSGICSMSHGDESETGVVGNRRQTIRLEPAWRVQPAVNPDFPPAIEDWGEISSTSGDWRWGHVKAEGTSWGKTLAAPGGRAGIHCLWYEQTVMIPASWMGTRIGLHFKRIEGDAIVYVDDTRVAELLRPGGEVDLSDAVRHEGNHILRVFLTRDYTGISRDFDHDPLRYTARAPGTGETASPGRWGFGITAPVTLTSYPRDLSVTDVFIQTSWRKKAVSLEVEVLAAAPAEQVSIQADIQDADGQVVLALKGSPVSVPAGCSTQTLTASWPDPVCWELEQGYLYTARVTALRGSEPLDHADPVRFGFREIWVEGRNVYLNGHLSRWRVDWTACGLSPESLSLFRLMGRNVFYTQANPTAWWCTWSETPLLDEALLDAFDTQGMGTFVPVPGISHLRGKLLDDPQAQADYEREMKRWMRLYRNHPSILGWTVGMNSFCPRDGIHPSTMGKRVDYRHTQANVIRRSIEIVKGYDPTRLAYSHADGNLGDLATSNSYLNFAPLQEREDWPMEWARAGDMPYFPVEFGQPYTANFWKGKQFLMTEYLAMYFGDRAYREETDELLADTVSLSLANTSGHGGRIPFADVPLYWEFQRLFISHTDRSWRTWGVPGWYYWDFSTGYGDPPGWDGKNIWSRYAAVREPLSKRPDWVNPNFDIRAENEQSLLVWLAGTPVHTDKTHAFYAREAVSKQIAVVWDGPGEKRVAVTWTCRSDDGVSVAAGEVELTLNAGDIVFSPVEFTAPDVAKRTTCTLSMEADTDGVPPLRDTFQLQVFPREVPAPPNVPVFLFDPTGKSGPWLAELGVRTTPWEPESSLPEGSLLIIGREALKQGSALPFSADRIAAGLRVLILEQQPEIWEGFGFHAMETMSRYVFARDDSHGLLDGLEAEDLINWRGSPDLLPECKAARSHDIQHAPKWTNRHALASVVLEIPHRAGFRPLLVAEFDLSYTPLLEWPYGRGTMICSTLDFTGRVGRDPCATRLACNLLNCLAAPRQPTRAVYWAGEDRAGKLLDVLGAAPQPASDPGIAGNALLVVAPGEGAPPEARLERFAGAGGIVISLPQTPDRLETRGIHSAATVLRRTEVPNESIFRGIGPDLLRWREGIPVDAFSQSDLPADRHSAGSGAFLIRPCGRGFMLDVQIDPFALDTRYKDASPEFEAVQLSRVRLRQLWSRLLTNAGAASSEDVAARLTTLKAGTSYETLGQWFVLGPFFPEDANAKPGAILDAEFPGETAALAGDTNPNTVYTRRDGTQLDFRTTVQADKDEFLNLAAVLKADTQAVAYATRTVTREQAGTAILRLGIDYWLKVWVNGRLVYRMDQGHGAPKPNRHLVKIGLKAGENVITLKVLAGSKGFGFWANLAQSEEDSERAAGRPGHEVRLYDPSVRLRDPYEYVYW